MKTTIHNQAHKNLRIPEHTYIMRQASQCHGRQPLSLISPRLNKIFNSLNSNTMKRGENVSENVPAVEFAEENVILSNHSNSKKMRTLKKVASTLAFLSAFLMAVNVGLGQEQTVKAADATEVVSLAKETKDSLKSEVKVPLKSSLVKLNMKAGMEKKSAVDKKLTVDDELIWFPTMSETNCNPNLNYYPADNDLEKPEAFVASENPIGCSGGTFKCCAIGYNPDDVVYNSTLNRWEPVTGASGLPQYKP